MNIMTLEQIKERAISALQLGFDFETVIKIAAEQIKQLKEYERREKGE